jgi:hypothetical protein
MRLNLFTNSDLHARPIEGQFYNYKFVNVTVSSQTQLQIDKILHTGKKDGIKKHLVKWKGYDETFNSWVNVQISREYTGSLTRKIAIRQF